MLFAIQDSLIKQLSQRYPVLEVLTLRSLIVLLLLLAIGVAFYGRRVIIGRQHRLMLLRGVLAFFAFTSYYIALKSIPLADAASVYMTAPLFVTLLSGLLLHERVGIHRWIPVVVGFGAVLIILNPGSSVFRIEAAIPLFSALCYATIPIINRRIGMTEHAMTMGIYTTAMFFTLVLLSSLALQLLPAPPPGNRIIDSLFQAWQPMNAADFILSCIAGAVFACALLSITQAYRIARVATVAPFEYSYLVVGQPARLYHVRRHPGPANRTRRHAGGAVRPVHPVSRAAQTGRHGVSPSSPRRRTVRALDPGIVDSIAIF